MPASNKIFQSTVLLVSHWWRSLSSSISLMMVFFSSLIFILFCLCCYLGYIGSVRWNAAYRWGCVVEIFSTHWPLPLTTFHRSRTWMKKHHCFNVRYRKSLLCLQDQFCNNHVQKKQLNCCFRQLAVELHGNGSAWKWDWRERLVATKPKPL